MITWDMLSFAATVSISELLKSSTDQSRTRPASTPGPSEERRHFDNVPKDNPGERRPSWVGVAKLLAFRKGCGTASIDAASKWNTIEDTGSIS